ERYLDNSTRADHHPDCDCGDEQEKETNGGQGSKGQVIALLNDNKFGIVSDYMQGEHHLSMPSLGLRANVSVQELLSSPAKVDAAAIPAHIRFLADIRKRKVNLNFMRLDSPTIYMESSMLSATPATGLSPEDWSQPFDLRNLSTGLRVLGARNRS